MKKVLSILASIGLVATTATTVIACAKTEDNNPNVSFNQVQAWFNNAQPVKQADGTWAEGKTMLIAIGGRHNSDTLSYLATLNRLVNGNRTVRADEIIRQENITSFENKINSYDTSTATNESEKGWQDPIKDMINSNLSNDENGWDNDPNQVSTIAKNYFHHDYNKPVKTMEFHTILVDNVENFWDNNLGKAIIENIIAKQMKEVLEFAFNDGQEAIDNDLIEMSKDQKEFDKFIKKKTKNLVTLLQGDQVKDNGPWFLVVNSGKIVGIKTGFRNYWEFNKEYGKRDKADNSLRETNDLAENTFKEFSQSVVKGLRTGIDWLRTNFINTEDKISSSNIFKRNAPDKDAAAWTAKVSGKSNVEDLKKPRGEDVDDNDNDEDNENGTDEGNGEDQNPASLTYHYTFLD